MAEELAMCRYPHAGEKEEETNSRVWCASEIKLGCVEEEDKSEIKIK